MASASSMNSSRNEKQRAMATISPMRLTQLRNRMAARAAWCWGCVSVHFQSHKEIPRACGAGAHKLNPPVCGSNRLRNPASRDLVSASRTDSAFKPGCSDERLISSSDSVSNGFIWFCIRFLQASLIAFVGVSSSPPELGIREVFTQVSGHLL